MSKEDKERDDRAKVCAYVCFLAARIQFIFSDPYECLNKDGISCTRSTNSSRRVRYSTCSKRQTRAPEWRLLPLFS